MNDRRLITFDAYRALGVPGVRYLNPDTFDRHLDAIRAADWVLFPPSWQVNTLHHALGKRLFPSVASYRLGHDKIEMTRALRAVAPAHVPDTLILPSTDTAVAEALWKFTLPVVVKIPRSSMGQGVELIESAGALRRWAAGVPTLYVQEYLPCARDLRVVWLGDAVVAAYWREAADGAFHNNVARGGRLSFEGVPVAALQLVERVARQLGIDHAGFDLIEYHGHFYILEFNVLFGNEGLNRQGINTGRLIHEHIERHSRDNDDPPPAPRWRVAV